jgi:CheY-like chemotaxis protein
MTGFALEELVQGALEDGAFTVLPKPFDVAHALEVATRAARGPTVLVVDDVIEVADATAAALEASGLKASAVHSGDEALEAVKSGAVDLCVVDLVMPGMSGPELVGKLRALAVPVAVIAVSGEDVPALIRDVATLGMYSFLRKPVGARELTRTIATARGAQRKRPAGGAHR